MLVTVMVDASLCGQTGAAGFGAWIKSERSGQAVGGEIEDVVRDSGIAEMSAVQAAIASALDKKLIEKGDYILVQTDNMEVVDILNGQVELTSDTERRREMIQVVRLINKMRFQHNVQIKMRHVKGHTNLPHARNRANHHCDVLAKKHMMQRRNKLQTEN